MTTASQDRIHWNFSYHRPDEEKTQQHERVRQGFTEFAFYLDAELAGESPEKSLTITKLEEAIMWANAHIARNPRPE